MIIDMYSFLGFWPYWNVNETTAESLVELMNRFEVNKAAVCSLRGIFYNHEEGNLEVFKALSRFPDRLIGIATVYPYDDKCSEAIERCFSEFNMKGLELQPNHQMYSLENSAVEPMLNVASARKIPVIIPLRLTMNWNFPATKVSDIAKLVAAYADTVFIAGCFSFREMNELVALMKKHDNLMLETSGLHLMHGIERLVSHVGAERILFGSGMPIQSVGPALAKIKEAEIKEEEKQLILEKNAARILNLH